MTTLRRHLRLIWILGLWVLAAASSAIAADRPNVVLILADDVGLGDIGRQHLERTGNPPLAPTPTIDALASEGLWFTDAHSPTALCSPSRYAFMSGNYTCRSYAPWGVWGSFRQSPLNPHDATLGTVAQSAGYATGFIGKWHLGGDFNHIEGEGFYRGDDRGDEPLNIDASRWIGGGPQNWGFDYDFTLPTGVQGPFYVAYENGVWSPLEEDSQLIHLDDKTAKDPIFVSDKGPGTGDSAWDATQINRRLAEEAAAFIHRSAGDRPFFLCYWTPAVHIPHTPPDALEGKAIKGTTPSPHLDMIRVLDWEVKEIVRALRESGEYDNTLILFTSDNGGLWNPTAKQAGHLSNGGWRGNKNNAFEGGHRVPLIAVWPGVIEPGTHSDALVGGTDMVATLAAVAGTELSDAQAIDSWSLLPLLKGDSRFQPRSELMLQSGTENRLVFRQGQWKLIIQSDFERTKWEPFALFDLETNPQEKEDQNLLHGPEHQDRVAAMLQRCRQTHDRGDRKSHTPRP